MSLTFVFIVELRWYVMGGMFLTEMQDQVTQDDPWCIRVPGSRYKSLCQGIISPADQ